MALVYVNVGRLSASDHVAVCTGEDRGPFLCERVDTYLLLYLKRKIIMILL